MKKLMIMSILMLSPVVTKTSLLNVRPEGFGQGEYYLQQQRESKLRECRMQFGQIEQCMKQKGATLKPGRNGNFVDDWNWSDAGAG